MAKQLFVRRLKPLLVKGFRLVIYFSCFWILMPGLHLPKTFGAVAGASQS